MIELIFLILVMLFGFKVLKLVLRITCLGAGCLVLYLAFRIFNRKHNKQ